MKKNEKKGKDNHEADEVRPVQDDSLVFFFLFLAIKSR